MINTPWAIGQRVSKAITMLDRDNPGKLIHGRTFGKVKAFAGRADAYLIIWDDGTERVERAEDLQAESWGRTDGTR
jgi:hypothetical protein